MKIVMVLTELGPGGAERVTADLGAALVEQGHECTVLSLAPPPSYSYIPDKMRENGVRPVYLNGKKSAPWSLLRRLKRVLREERPDVVHSHLIHPNILSRLALLGSDTPLVNTIHIAERRRGMKGLFLLDRLTVSRADAITAVSDAAARFHEKACGLPDNTIRTIYNGVDPVEFVRDPKRAVLRRQWFASALPEGTSAEFPTPTTILGCAGRLHAQKGYDILLRRANAIAERIPAGETWGLVFLGDGPELDALRLLACEIEKKTPNLRFAFPGFSPAVPYEMGAFDAFLMPSRYEGYGLVLTEAMCVGLPVVTSNADSLPELCQRYPGFSRCIPLDADPDGSAFADAVRDAVAAGRSEPFVVMTRKDMTRAYVQTYNDAIQNHTKK